MSMACFSKQLTVMFKLSYAFKIHVYSSTTTSDLKSLDVSRTFMKTHNTTIFSKIHKYERNTTVTV